MTAVGVAQLREVLEEASEIVTRSLGSSIGVSYKDDGTPLTAVDTASNRFLARALRRLLPEAGWLSEETTDGPRRRGRAWVWVVDPLDGTKELARGLPEFAVSVGLVHEGSAVLGGVVNPATGEGGAGSPGGEVLFWGCAPAAGPAADLRRSRAAVSRIEVEDGSVLPYLALVGEARPIGSVAYKLLRVAAGLDDLTFSIQPKSEWDVCGGVALVEAAGKFYRRFDGEPILFNRGDTRIRSGAVAGPRSIVDEFLEQLATRGTFDRKTA